jgi:hypothetical protein
MEAANNIHIRERFDGIMWVNAREELLPSQILFDNDSQITNSDVVVFEVLLFDETFKVLKGGGLGGFNPFEVVKAIHVLKALEREAISLLIIVSMKIKDDILIDFAFAGILLPSLNFLGLLDHDRFCYYIHNMGDCGH